MGAALGVGDDFASALVLWVVIEVEFGTWILAVDDVDSAGAS